MVNENKEVKKEPINEEVDEDVIENELDESSMDEDLDMNSAGDMKVSDDTKQINIESNKTIEKKKLSDDEKKEMGQSIDNIIKGGGTVCSFDIQLSKLLNFISYIKCKGNEGISSILTNSITDCIFRFSEKDNRMWVLVTDVNRTLVIQSSISVNNLKNPTEIPVVLEDLEKWLSSFDKSDNIEFLYQNGVIGLKNKISDKDKTTKNLFHTTVIYFTIRKESIINDLILNLEFAEGKVSTEYLNKIKEFGQNCYEIKDGVFNTFFGCSMAQSFSLPSIQLQKIVIGGKIVENKKYPFEFTNGMLKVTVKSSDESIDDSITRILYPEKFNVKKNFSVTFTSILESISKHLSGNVQIYVDENCPMALLPQKDKENDIEIMYLIVNL